MTKVEKISFLLITAILLLVGFTGLGMPFLTVLFSYLAMSIIARIIPRPAFTVVAFTALVIGVFTLFVLFIRTAITTLPHVTSASIPLIIEYAKSHNLEFFFPFEDAESLRTLVVETMKGELGFVANYAKLATKEFISLLIGLVVAASLFLNTELDLDKEKHAKRNNLYSALCAKISERFTRFYQSFATVMGAQLIISSINTLFTAIYLLIAGVPHGMILVVITFVCGMIPVVGNLISNTIIFSVSMTISVKLAVSALVFLIVLHKFEYFLNGKIIGSRIRNPMWLTLLSLVVGEKLIGIPGMILAPVILNYIKVETSSIDDDL